MRQWSRMRNYSELLKCQRSQPVVEASARGRTVSDLRGIGILNFTSSQSASIAADRCSVQAVSPFPWVHMTADRHVCSRVKAETRNVVCQCNNDGVLVHLRLEHYLYLHGPPVLRSAVQCTSQLQVTPEHRPRQMRRLLILLDIE